VLAGAAPASKTRHAAREHDARQEFPELALDELRQALSVAGLRHRAQEGLQVLGDDLMKHGVLASRGRYTGATHPMPLSSAPVQPCPCPEMDTQPPP
jgi:hypothetical protein